MADHSLLHFIWILSDSVYDTSNTKLEVIKPTRLTFTMTLIVERSIVNILIDLNWVQRTFEGWRVVQEEATVKNQKRSMTIKPTVPAINYTRYKDIGRLLLFGRLGCLSWGSRLNRRKDKMRSYSRFWQGRWRRIQPRLLDLISWMVLRPKDRGSLSKQQDFEAYWLTLIYLKLSTIWFWNRRSISLSN